MIKKRARPLVRTIKRLRSLRQLKPSGWKQPSKRELQILALAATGLSYALIAKKLSISPSTVKNMLYRVRGKLDAQGAANAVWIAWRRDVLEVKLPNKTMKPLSQDERRVLVLIAQGFTNKSIQAELDMTTRAFLNTIHSLHNKLGNPKTRAELIATAIHFGLLQK